MTRRSTTEVREAVQKLVHEAIDPDLTDSDSHLSTKAADDDISPADELQLIGCDQRITDGFKTYIFCNDVNPMTRVPKFNNLKGRALYNAIQDLPRREQCQELMPLFSPLDTLICYLFDEESLKIPKRKTVAEKGQDAWVPMAHGYPRKMICKKKILHKKRTNMLTYMKVVLEMLQTAEPGFSPPPGPTEINITIEGPLDMSCTVINQAMPQALISAVKAAKPGKGARKAKISGSMCVKTMIELFHDEQETMRLITATWHRHHAIDASLKPWGPYQKISDVNPQVLHADHFLQKSCMPGFWAHSFDTEVVSRLSMKLYAEAYCCGHECMEAARDLYPQLPMQLVCGFFTYDY
jgi:hypothetical protein